MAGFDHRNIKEIYSTRRHGGDIGRDFIGPALSVCKYYRRNLGSFSSEALIEYLESMQNFVRNDVKIKILCSPYIDKITLKVLSDMEDEDKRSKYINNELIDKQLLKAAKIKENQQGLKRGWKEDLLCYLIANDILEFRIAVPLDFLKPQEMLSNKYIELGELKSKSNKDRYEEISEQLLHSAQFHTKIGYFEFSNGDEVTFTGSANESLNAFKRSIEDIEVFRSWESNDVNRVIRLKKTLDGDWNCNKETEKDLGFRIFSIGDEALDLCKSYSPNELPKEPKDIPPEEIPPVEIPPVEPKNISGKYRHQDEAVETFLVAENGILEMATGTGKTRTAQKIINKLLDEEKIDQFVVTLNGVDLLEQWYQIFLDSAENEPESEKLRAKGIQILKENGDKENRKSFVWDPKKRGLCISINDVHNVLDQLNEKQLSRTLLIYDEVHDLGTDIKLNKLEELNKKVSFKLGLSATPYLGEFKKDLNERLVNTIGDVIFQFDIKDAIQREILCEFNYETLDYELTMEELEEKNSLIGKSYGAGQFGNKGAEKALRNQIATIHKKAEDKLNAFEKYLENHKELLKSSIIFTNNKIFAREVTKILFDYTNNFKTYFHDTDRENLDKFRKNEIDILVTCDAISQGIDIPYLNNIILFSADKGQSRSTTQRLGRCLRNPSSTKKKVANVIDFKEVASSDKDSYDEGRVEWLSSLSNIKGGNYAK